MKITPIAYVQEMHGKIPGGKSEWHARTNKYGTIFLARNGVSNKPPTEKQLEYRERLRKASHAYQQVKADPERMAQWQERFEQQDKYTSLRGMVIGEMMKML